MTQQPETFTDSQMDDENLTVESEDVTESVIHRLAEAGMSANIISYALDMPESRVRGIVLARRPEPIPLLDEKLADGVRKLASAALTEAHTILEFGPTEQKMVIIKAMLSGLSKHVTTTGTQDAEEARREYEAILFEMRTGGIPERDRIVREHDIIEVVERDAEPETLAPSLDDQDEGY